LNILCKDFVSIYGEKAVNKQAKIFIFEFDSGSWNVLDHLLSEGKLPTIKRMMNEGAYGILQSDTLPISPRVWTTIFTGKHSQKHRVEFFASTSSCVKHKRLWDIFSAKGLKVGIFGSLVTWPPYKVNGFMIPSIFSLGPETYPEDYKVLQEIAVSERKTVHKKEKRRVKEYLGTCLKRRSQLKSIGVISETFRAILKYLIGEKVLRFNPKEQYWRKAFLHLRITVDVFIHLYRRFQPDFVTFHNHLCDAVSHRYWDCYEPQHFNNISSKDIKKYGGVIPHSYYLTDKMLARILSHLDPLTTIFIISDHGAKAHSDIVTPYNLNFDNFLCILKIQDRVIPARFGIKGIIYFTDNELRENILDTVKSISLTETGEKIFNVESQEQYIALSPGPGLRRKDMPDDTLVTINGFGTYPLAEIFSRQKIKISGVHHKEGIFIACGPTIKKGAKPNNATIFDISPTVLFLMGFPVAKDMDGRVLTEIIENRVLLDNPINYVDTYEDDNLPVAETSEKIDIEKIKSRLSDLGYL
jgi:predicted AlkP superfamily phosphohydrolase/phosphomutase